jgi:microcystin-dependent protein
MSSPITGSSWTIATPGESFCARITNLLSLSSKMKLWFDWAFDSSGNATDDFKSMFLLPPGVIMPYYSNGSEEAIKASVMTLNGGTSASPFWRLCDGTGGTPDLRGRAIIGAGQGSGLTQRAFNSVGGAESVTINSNDIPAHGHIIEGRLRFATAKNVDGEDDFGAVANLNGSSQPYEVTEYSTSSSDNNYLYAKPQAGGQDTLEFSTMSPYTALWYIMRTTRTE